VTERSGARLHVWLITDEGNGASFVVDVERMLHSIANRDGVRITEYEVASFARPQHLFGQLSGEAGRALLAELGIHRAQLVPPGSVSGRIATVLVGVELVAPDTAPSSSRPNGQILKTYNYPLRRVTRHATGQVLALDAVLSGEP
jgi:protein subunit release factor A